MSAITEFDVGPLTWVKGEIDHALSQASDNLTQLSENMEDVTPIRYCLTHLHQVTGAIQMVGLEGAARYSAEIEKFVTGFEKQEVVISPEHIELIKQAITALVQYLDELIGGEPDLPLKLFPFYQKLLQAQNIEKHNESDLFFPDLSTRAPKNKAVRTLSETDFPQFIKNQRSRFQRGLLQWLKGEGAAGLPEMREALREIDTTQSLPAHRTFWWAAIAFVDSLINQGLKAEFNVKQLCARIDLQMRKLVEGSPKVAERLLRDVLYFVARSQAVSDSVKEVKQVFELDDYLPVAKTQTDEEEADHIKLQSILRELRDAVSTAKESWLKYTSGNKDSLTNFQQQSAKLIAKAEALDSQPMNNLVNQIGAVAAVLSEVNETNKDTVALEMATALLLIENTTENYKQQAQEFVQQSEVQVKRLQASISGNLGEIDIPEVPLLGEMSRKAQEKMLLSQVANEIQTNLRNIEQVLDSYFRDTTKRNDLVALDPTIHQISGALSILDMGKAVELLAASQDLIRKFSQEDYVVEEQEHELVAEALSSLGFYVDAIQYGRTDAERILIPVLKRLTGKEADTSHEPIEVEISEEVEPDLPTISVESGLDEQKQQLKSCFEALQKTPADNICKVNVKAVLTSLRQDADLVADHLLNLQASKALTLLSQSGDEVLPELEASIAEITALKVQASAPSAEASRMKDASEDAVDAELLETYLEEAEEVLGRVQENLQICQGNPHDREALTTIRRGFHTLKGSGRMVGLNTLGEVAWGIEQVMNKWMEEEKSATPALLQLISQSHDAFAEWVKQLNDSGTADVQAEDLLAFAEQLKNGEVAVQADEVSEPELVPEELTFAPIEPEEIAFEAEPVDESELPLLATEAEEETVILEEDSESNQEIIEEEIEAVQASEIVPNLENIPVFGAVESPVLSSFDADTPIAEEAVQEERTPELIASPPFEAEAEAEATPKPELIVVSEAAVEEMPAPEEDVVIGEAVISPVLFSIFMKEAEQHLQTLSREYAGVTESPEQPIAHEFMRAAHTLCGIARTTGITAVADLGHAMELWLQEQLDNFQPFSDKHIKVMGDTVASLNKMLSTISEHKPPKPAKQLIISLQAMLKRAVAEREERHEKAAEVLRAQEKAQADGIASALAEEHTKASIAEIPVEMKSVSSTPSQSERVAENVQQDNEQADRRRVHDDLDEQLLPIFLEEAQELFPEIGGLLRDLRTTPTDLNLSNSLQRALHTLKGSSRMAGAMRLGELTHNMEDKVVVAIESNSLTPELFDDLEAEFDRLGDSLERLKTGEQDIQEVISATKDSQSLDNQETAAVTGMTFGEFEQAAQKALLRVRADVVDRLVSEAGEVSIARSRIEGEMQSFKQSLFDLTENVIRLRNQLREVEIQAESQMQSRLTLVSDEDTTTFDPLEFDRFTRFQELTRMMAESVNDVSTVQQNLLKNLDETEAALLQQARMNRELQQELMHIRMVPINSLTERMYRIVRQTAKELGKKANLDIRGANVELDRSVLEKMTAPFEHLLRNAIAHGLEVKAKRLAAGKAEIGDIQLQARQEGNEIILTLSDDGAGIDLEAIRKKALQLNLIEDGQVLDDAVLMELIFSSGFSTAQEVSQVAGRGVGMDVVRNEVASLGGRIEVNSEYGKGTTFTIYLPLTLAVTQTLLIKAGAELFAIPSSMVEQVQELKAKPLAEVYGKKEIEWQGNKYPFFYLPRLLGDEEHQPISKNYNSILLLRSGALRTAIHVDELQGNREIVVKNIGPQLARVSGIAGATVLGNGKVVLILNPVQLAHREAMPIVTAKIEAPVEVEEKPSNIPLIMVVDDSLTVRKITSRLLSREGYQVITAKDGVEALQELQDAQPSVMLVDIEMPRMDGFELTRNVRGDSKTANIPIIMITSRTAEKHRNYAKELGVDVYLGKPYQEEELLEHIESFIKAGIKH
ncbi:hybrid sensor histidine kinase/response regulator [Sulfurirhabdus autotrophica]|uniref:Chemotaxis protein CheA n=1 Tax=Sulfurirhabdus autotrophica TaxID=1706046 RepID=A0A4R3XU23_9PROT|nr:Hpt domain-containing protein [Sulfurirhabdus autotrophica]TCV82367.1 chemosensory pili system protein ChpA (sensor histidine kinase/response regulator) [Sulfurirhabdus autotrophica]